jgi:biopolymer transport protein ExbD
MITSKFIYFNQIDISANNAETKTESTTKNEDKPIYITIIDKDKIKYLGQQYALSELPRLLEANLPSSIPSSRKEKIPVIISINNKTGLQDFVSLIETLQSENLHNFQLRKIHV